MKNKIIVVLLLLLLSGCTGSDDAPDVIEDEIAPNIYGIEDIEIDLNSRFNPLDGVFAYDVQDGYITENIQLEGQVDTSEHGIYLIKYKVTDSNGHQTLELRYITVLRGELYTRNIFPYGEFNNQLEGYGIYVEPGTGDANFYTQDGVMVIEILNIEQGKWYCPRLNTWGVEFIQGKEYIIEFDGRALDERLIQIQVGELLEYNPWFDRFDKDTNHFTLTNSWTTFSYSFIMNKDTNNNGSILFELGDISGDTTITTVYLDNIKIMEVE